MDPKRTRTTGKVKHNGLKLHPNQALPFALECKILDFLHALELAPLLDTSRDCRTLLEGFLGSTSSLVFHRTAKLAIQMRMMNAALVHCKRLQRMKVTETVGDPSDRMSVAIRACNFTRANSATLQEFDVGSSAEVCCLLLTLVTAQRI